MVYLTILDSGYLKPTNEGTQLSSANRANSGSAINIKNTTFVPESKNNLDDTPNIGTESEASVNVGSFENIKFNLNIRLNMDDSTDRGYVFPLLMLTRTKGYKFLYYPSTGTDAPKQLIYQLSNGHTFTAGEQTAFSLGGAYRHLHVHFSTITFNADATKKNIVVASLKGIVTKSETSVV